jgi:hypothetical protein
MARSRSRRSSKKSSSKRGRSSGSKQCVKPSACRVIAAEMDFKSSKGCGPRTAAAEAMRIAAAKSMRGASKTEKQALFRKSLKTIASAHRSCGREGAAREAERQAGYRADHARHTADQPMDGLLGLGLFGIL